MKCILRAVCALLLFWGVLLALFGLWRPVAYADGGAPQLAYVAGAPQGVGVIDIAQRRVTGALTLADQPRMVLLSLDGSALYVTQPKLGRVVVIATKTGKTICSAQLPGQPSLLALSIDATVLYAAGLGDDSVRALNPATCVVERVLKTNSQVYGLAVAASTEANATPSTPNQIWVAGESELSVFDATGPLLGDVSVSGGPQYISIPTGGLTAYVTTRQGTLFAVDLTTRRLIRELLSGGQYGPMDYNETTGEIYVPDSQHDLLDVLTPITASTTAMPHEPARQLPLSGSPQAVAITNDGQLGFAALASGQVLMLDIPGRSVIASITIGGTPHFIITGLYPPAGDTSTPGQPTSPSASAFFPRTLLVLVGLCILAVLLLAGSGWFIWRRVRT